MIALPVTYEPIAGTTISTNQNDVTFSNVPGTYTDLILIINSVTATSTAYVTVTLNSDTGNNYSRTALYGDGTSAGSTRASNENVGYLAQAAYNTNTLKFNSIHHFMNYSNTTTNKTILSRANHADLGTDAVVTLWRNTAAITTIKINSSFGVNSTLYLYGIKAA